MISAVLDCNVYISALVFGGNPRKIIELAQQGAFEIHISPPIRRDVERVMEIKFQWPKARIREATSYLWTLAQPVVPRHSVADCVDPDDNRVLECALETKADVIVTGDRHLLQLHPYRGISILAPKRFLEAKLWQT
ncbi:MAG TPA: putative toxin-antitoxin system toxin component, PIN family [Bryobacteraceae bacterium]|nr:putative toxin-antitoxin system toxin component, PIN family [Bryobacteraceae bacterium]